MKFPYKSFCVHIFISLDICQEVELLDQWLKVTLSDISKVISKVVTLLSPFQWMYMMTVSHLTDTHCFLSL